MASIREKGVLEPILVRQQGSRYQIIAGERRYRAAMEVGLAEIPCIVFDCSDAEVMEIALVENLQRKDLSPFEEADGLRTLAQKYGYTHELMAEKLGKSRTSITEAMSLAAIPDDVRQLCRLADIQSKSLLLQVVRQSDAGKMAAFVERLQQDGATREQARRIAKEVRPRGASKTRARAHVFRYQPKEKGFTLLLKFRKSDVPRAEVVRVLEGILAELREQAG
jgi:ParB family chromosome partitioning protein